MHCVSRGIELTVENKVNNKTQSLVQKHVQNNTFLEGAVRLNAVQSAATDLELEGCDEVVRRFLVAVCLLVVCLDLFLLLLLLLLLDDLPDFLLQLWRDDELVVGVRLGRSVEVAPLLPDRGVGRFLYEVLVPSLAGHGAVGSSAAS